MATKRITDNHPTMLKFNTLCNLAEDLGISLDFDNYRTILRDKEFPDISFEILDNEDYRPVMDLPPFLEFKIVFESD